MNNFGIKRNELKDRTRNILERDKREDTLESLIHNYSKEERKQEKQLISKEEFFKEKENKNDSNSCR